MAEVAVIVPVYNAGAYLEKCIESIRSQTFEDLEICLIDDGSRDGSGDVCDAHAAADGRVRVVHQENAGLMAAWMRGVRETSAPYLFFSDADDYIDPDAIEVLARALSGEKKEVVIGALLTDKRNGKAEPEGCRAAAGVYEGGALRKLQAELLGNEVRALPFSRCMKLFSRALIEENMRLCEPRLRMA